VLLESALGIPKGDPRCTYVSTGPVYWLLL